MAGYSATPLPKKLGISEGKTVALLNVPPGLDIELPPGVSARRQARGHAEVVVAFFTERSEFERRIAALESMIFPDGGLWIAWPKRASAVLTDMTEHVVRDVAIPRGLVDTKVCALNDTWSGLRIVWRRERRGVIAGGLAARGRPARGGAAR